MNCIPFWRLNHFQIEYSISSKSNEFPEQKIISICVHEIQWKNANENFKCVFMFVPVFTNMLWIL